jgi:glycosyltransferase involved in cell wall biosynthesis
MRLLIISHMYPNRVSPLGGIFVQKQTKALADLGVDIAIIAPVPWVPSVFTGLGKWGGYPQVPHVETEYGFEVYHPRVLEFPRSWLFELYPGTYQSGMKQLFEERILKGVDLVHAHVAHPDGAAALKLAKKFSIPVVVTIHGQDFAYSLMRSERCAASVRSTLNAADGVILVSDKLKDSYGLETWNLDMQKVRVIYNGVDIERDNQAVIRNSNHKVLLSVGFLRPDKGHEVVIRSLRQIIARFPNIIYKIVGDGSERQKLERLARELNVVEHVQFLGSLPHAEAMQQMAACDIFVLPSWREAFGVVYLEAMAHGKPIIGTEGEGIAEIINTESVGLTVPPKNSTALAAALIKLLGDDAISREMGQRGRRLVEKRFSWEHNARTTLQFYQEVLKEQRGK